MEMENKYVQLYHNSIGFIALDNMIREIALLHNALGVALADFFKFTQ